VNNRLLPAEVLREYGGGVDLPYFQNSRHVDIDNALRPAAA
jgi:hypothetical protein